jgi:hypothetical protein
MSDFVGEAVSQRLEDDEASRLRALGAAIIIGFAAAVLAYRVLRGSSEEPPDAGSAPSNPRRDDPHARPPAPGRQAVGG